MAKIDAFFKLMNDQGASDLHLVSGSQPILRVHGEMERVKYKLMENDELKTILYEICPENKIKMFEETGDIDLVMKFPIWPATAAIFSSRSGALVRFSVKSPAKS
jgi:twitching motility protein PilT